MNFIKLTRCCTPLLLLSLGMVAATGAAGVDNGVSAASAPVGQIFAIVNGKSIAVEEYFAQYRDLIRKRYYHGDPPEAEVEAVRKEVSDLLIERELLIGEAERRGMQPDATMVEQALTAADTRFGAEPGWRQQRKQLLAELKEMTTRQSMFEQVEKAIRNVPPPSTAEVHAYYLQKPELFTEPEKLRLSEILLSVDPGAPRADWDKAREEAQAIYQRLNSGADFAELARQYSTDPSAKDGGDRGYLHGGVLGQDLQGEIDKIQIGKISEPITILEGVAIYRVENRIPAKLHEFAEVERRAQDLLRRDQSEQAWKETVNRLRKDAEIEILVPLGANKNKQEAAGKKSPQ